MGKRTGLFYQPCFFRYVLLLEGSEKTEHAVDDEKHAANDDDDVKTVTKCDNKTDYHVQNGENEGEDGSLSLEGIHESEKSLDCEKDTENEKNDLSCCPTEDEDRDTDNEADRTANEIFSDNIQNT